MLPFIQLFGFEINMYWLSVAFGIVFACGLAFWRASRSHFNVPVKHVLFTFLFIILGARVGAVLFKAMGHIFLYATTPDFWTLENWIVLLSSGGVFYGGLIGGFFAAFAYVKSNKINFQDISDILMPSIPLFHVFGRMGCFFAGCCHGIQADWGIAFSQSISAPNGIPFIPVQLFEIGLNLWILLVTLILRPERIRQGVLLPMYLITYSVGRFILEFIRGDMARGIFLLSTSQWISVVVLPVAVILLIQTLKCPRLQCHQSHSLGE